jgi:hypothetical protein
MGFGVCLLSEGHPELITVGSGKDGLTLFAKLLAIGLSDPIDISVEGWEVVVN